jgi:hypothetical protein
MAEVKLDSINIGNVQVVKWTLGNADTGQPWLRANHQDKFLQINGTFGGATVILQGTNDYNADNPNQPPASATWTTLVYAKDGAAISETSADGGQILDCPLWIRPSSSGGTGTAAVVSITSVRGF